MKKNFLFKGVHVLGAVMLFASAILPGWQVYATYAFSPIKVANITNEALASETYNFTSYAEQAATTEYATGAVKVINKGTIVNVTENYKVDDESGFVGKEYYVKATNNTAGTKYPLWSGLNAVNDEGISVEILDGDNENGYNFVSYAGDTKRGNGKVSVVETGAVVKVINNYKLDDTNDFVGKSFYVDETNCTVNGGICTVYTSVEGEPVQAGFFVRITETLDDGYSFISYADGAGETKWGDGIVTVDNTNGNYKKVTVTKNYRLDDSFVDNEYVVTGANNGFYELYGLDGTDGGIAVTIGDPVLCGESKTCYDFVSYNPDDTNVKWGDGKVEVEYEYTKVRVDENYALDSSFNQNFVVYATEYGMYELYTTEAAPTGIWVEISSGDKENGYDFVSYSDKQKSTKRGNGKVEFVNGFTTVEVTENSIEGFAGNKFVVYATELSASDTVYQLYTTEGAAVDVYVKIEAIPQTTPSSSSNYSGGGGGGGSSKSSASSSNESKTDEKATNTAKADEQKADEAKADSKDGEVLGTVANEVAVPMTEAQAVAKFGQEQIDAYKWAHDKGITTMDTVEDARLDQPLTRAELAKMMVVYMVKIANKSPVVTGTVSYPDVKSEELGDLAGYIQLAYQFQIMGIDANGKPIDEFNPNGLVTRGEYATVFSRVLFGSLFNQEGEDFYSKHIAALNAAGILTNTDPTIQEMRGWVMLMMYRSSQNLEEIAKVAAEIGATDEEVEAGKKAAEILAEEEAKAQATTGDVAEAPAVEETASAEANTGEVAAEPSNN